MFFITLDGKVKRVSNPSKYLIDWDGKSRSKFQFTAKQFFKPYWQHDRVFEEFVVAGTKMHFDFYNQTKKIVIEIHGQQHSKFVKHFHQNRINFGNQLKRDLEKIEFCRKNGLEMVEIFYENELNEQFFKDKNIIL